MNSKQFLFFCLGLTFFSISAYPCIELPKKVKHTSGSFSKEVFEVSMGEYGPDITNGDSEFFFNYKKDKWCSRKKKSTAEPDCYNSGTKFVLKDSGDGKTVVARGVFNKDALIIFSVDENGQQSFNKPYMRISSDTVAVKANMATEYKTTIKMESIASNKQVDGVFTYEGKFGVFEDNGKFSLTGPRSRSLSIAKEIPADSNTSAVTLNGQDSKSASGCGGRTETNPYEAGANGAKTDPAAAK